MMKNVLKMSIFIALLTGAIVVSGCINLGAGAAGKPDPASQSNYVTGSLTPVPAPDETSSSDIDQAVLDKMTDMNNQMSPVTTGIADSLSSGNYTKAGLNAVILRNYIDQNLPAMVRLAGYATTEKAAAQEYVLYLDDLRSASDNVARGADDFNSGDSNDSTTLIDSGMQYLDSARAHLIQSTLRLQ